MTFSAPLFSPDISLGELHQIRSSHSPGFVPWNHGGTEKQPEITEGESMDELHYFCPLCDLLSFLRASVFVLREVTELSSENQAEIPFL